MIFVLFWFICAMLAGAIGGKKGEGGIGFLVGLFFGPFGVLFAILSSGKLIKCRFCKERIDKEASICPHCRQNLNTKDAA